MPKGSRKAGDKQDDLLDGAEALSEQEETDRARSEDRDQSAADDASEAVGEAGVPSTEEAEELTAEDKLRQELESTREDYLRLAAEFDNFKKRTNRDFASLIKSANENLIVELLEFIDNFSRAIESGENEPEFSSYHKGMKLVYDQLLEILGRHGLSSFDAVGEKFDPNLHEAIMQVDSDEYDPDHVAQEILKGYKLNDKVIRHAKVAVAGSGKED